MGPKSTYIAISSTSCEGWWPKPAAGYGSWLRYFLIYVSDQRITLKYFKFHLTHWIHMEVCIEYTFIAANVSSFTIIDSAESVGVARGESVTIIWKVHDVIIAAPLVLIQPNGREIIRFIFESCTVFDNVYKPEGNYKETFSIEKANFSHAGTYKLKQRSFTVNSSLVVYGKWCNIYSNWV